MKDPIKFGDMNFDIQINHDAPTDEIYLNTKTRSEFDKKAEANSTKGYATLAISPSFTKFIGENIYNIVQNLDVRNATKVFNNLLNNVKKEKLLTFYLNYDGSAGAAFGISYATTLTPIYVRALSGLFETNPQSIIDISKGQPNFVQYEIKVKNI
jgi:hypothetical protein